MKQLSFKRFLSLALSLVMMLTSAMTPAYATDAVTVPCEEHAFVTVINGATCTEDGSSVSTCSVCGYSQEEVLPATGDHKYVDGVCACGAADPDYKPECEHSYSEGVCTKCGATYHITVNPTKTPGICDHCGSEVVIRKDDAAETVRNRLKVYHESTEVLKDYYASKGKLRLVEGNQPIEDAYHDILRVLGETV